MDAREFLRLALDPGRLAVLGALATAPGTADELAERARQPRRAVLATLAALVAAGLAIADEETYRLDRGTLRALAQDLPQPPPPHPRVGFGMTEDEQVILGRFFEGERLSEIPAARSKRLVVLERLALEFEPGVRYPEPAVNELLSHFHEDYASLRRYLVDEGLLDRADGLYWRAGGRLPPSGC